MAMKDSVTLVVKFEGVAEVTHCGTLFTHNFNEVILF